MYTVIADVQITRRQSLHVVMDEQLQRQFAAKKIGDVLEWLFENGHHRFALAADGFRAEMVFTGAVPHPHPEGPFAPIEPG